MTPGLSTPDRSKAEADLDVPGRSDKQVAILAAALDILRAEGAVGLTVRNVAGRAGCSTTGVYTWFGGKNGLVDAIYIDGFESFDAALASVVDAPDFDPDLGWLVDRGLAYCEWAMAHPTEYQVMFARAVPEFEPGEHARARAMRSFDAHVASVRQVQAAGRLVGHDPEGVAYHLWATVHGHVMLELSGMDGGRGLPTDRRIADGLRTTLAGYGRAAENQTAGNQTAENQTAGNQTGENRTAGNQTAENWTAENRTAENRTAGNQTGEN